MRGEGMGPGGGGGGGSMRGLSENSKSDGASAAPAPCQSESKKVCLQRRRTKQAAPWAATCHRSPPKAGQKGSGDAGSVRKNLNETAFFYPHLLTGRDGTVKIVFTIPEALTKWHFMGHGPRKGNGERDH